MNDGNPVVRRIVTGHDFAGKAVVWKDGPATNFKRQGSEPSTHTSVLVWVTDRLPAECWGTKTRVSEFSGRPHPRAVRALPSSNFSQSGSKQICTVPIL